MKRIVLKEDINIDLKQLKGDLEKLEFYLNSQMMRS